MHMDTEVYPLQHPYEFFGANGDFVSCPRALMELTIKTQIF